ncbi:caspase domain-containing protein [Mycena galopus ATCC 62051]|nr:caspase domain-containing protein [Mycena galopus ATCC 62051]
MTSTNSRVFALVIGIDQYKIINKLHGCVNDANDFTEFLTKTLNVPESHIKLITDQSATREKIQKAFEEHLINNSDIRPKGDTIVVFYAGHGSRVDAPDNRYTPHGVVETICPQDEGDIVNGTYTHGIPDYTIHALLQRLAAEKGNDITAIFDSCNSGGIARHSKLAPRFAASAVPIPPDLDSAHVTSGNRLSGCERIPKGFRYKYMESHVLLAACREDQIAFEGTIGGVCRGRFSESLVRTLRALHTAARGEMTSYLELMDLIGAWDNQDPQVEGVHKTRGLLGEVYSAKPGKSITAREGGTFQVQMGSLEGVVKGTEFVVEDVRGVPVVLQARTVNSDLSILEVKDTTLELRPEILLGARATVSSWNSTPHMTLFVKEHVNPAASEALSPAQPCRFACVESEGVADITFAQEGNGASFVVERLRGAFKDHSLPPATFELAPEAYPRLPVIMDAVAHFHYFLHKHQTENPVLNVSLEMHDARDVSKNIFEERVARLTHNDDEADAEGAYCFTICNASPHTLFPYLFYFDPEKYTIQAWYTPPSPTMSAPLLSTSHGEPTRFPIGYGVGGEPFEFLLSPGQKMDTGFLKVFVSTKYIDLGWIEQESPFKAEFSWRLKGRKLVEKQDLWDAFYAIVTLQRT